MSTTNEAEPISVNQQDAAKLLGVSVWTLKRWEDRGLIASTKIDRVRLYPYADLKSLVPSGKPKAKAGK